MTVTAATPAAGGSSVPQPLETGTDYVVLHGATDHNTWTVYGTFKAHNDKQAIKLAIHDGLTADSPSYVAVPLRSWTPRTPTIDQKPTVKF